MAADQEDTDTETTSLPLDGLKAELDPPLRAPPSSEAVTAMVGSLQQYGLRSALIAVRLGEAVVVLDGRARLQAMRRLDEEGGLPLPCGTGASGIPVEILEPAEGFARIFDTHVALGPPRPAARIRTIQELLDWSDVKKFYVRTEIGRNGQAAGPQHQPSWSHVIARSSGMTRQRASKLVNIARVVPARVVCQVMSTSAETDATLDRLRMAIKNGVAPERALDQVRSKANAKTNGTVSGPPSVQEVADGLEAMAPDVRATYLRQLRRGLSAETFRIVRTAFALRGHRGPGRQGPSATARDRVRVSRRLAHLFDRSDLAVTMNDVARLADVGEASVNELYNQDNRTGKRQHILDSIDRVLDRLGIPDEQPP